MILSKIPAFFEFLNKVRCNSPVYHIADSIVRKLIIDVSTIIHFVLRVPTRTRSPQAGKSK